MYESLFILGIIFAVIAGSLLIATIAMFFGFNIPALRKEASGSLEQKQIEEIRKNSSAAANQRGRINVFEELEKKAKVKRNNAYSLNAATAAGLSSQRHADAGTSVLVDESISVNSNFIIEKNIMFVSTNEVM